MTQGDSLIVGGAKEGDILAGKYQIEKVLGIGGMGMVVAAYHLQLEERVAIKFLLPSVLDNPDAVGRFVREARAAVKIKSEHVARVIDVGTLETGSPYIVMEYLDGEDLSNWLKLRGALPIEQAVEFILQACEAIAEAHGHGIVHRDLKPANLFCIRRADGLLSIKVLDFGISKLTGAQHAGSGMAMTRTTAVMGSPYYMSPEQFQSARNVDARADIWSIGAVLYEVLARQVPFNGKTAFDLCIAITNQPTPHIRTVRPEVPIGLEEVISKCLEKDRNNRYSNVAQFAVALAPYGPKRVRASVERISRVIQNAGLSDSALALPPSSGEMEKTSTSTEVSWGQTTPPTTGKRKWMIVGALGVVAALGLAATVVARTSSKRGDEAARVASAPGQLSNATAAQVSTIPGVTTALNVQPRPDKEAPPSVPFELVPQRAGSPASAPAVPARPRTNTSKPQPGPAKSAAPVHSTETVVSPPTPITQPVSPSKPPEDPFVSMKPKK